MQVIRFTGVYKSYRRGGLALKNVSFAIAKGEFVFLTGPSGAGKSTLLKMISMETRPTDGEVRVSGFSSAKIHRREIPYLRRRLGIIFQDFRLLKNRTARENVAFALEVTGASREVIGPKVQRVLAAVGLAEKVDRYPRELSGGEQQRVAIARALVNDPFILLADEPTGNLDTKVSLEILRILREINSLGMAVLLATHDYNLLREHSEARVLHLDGGSLVSDTAAAEALTARVARAPAPGPAGSTRPEAASPAAAREAAGGAAPLRGAAPHSTIARAATQPPPRIPDRPLPPVVGEPRLGGTAVQRQGDGTAADGQASPARAVQQPLPLDAAPHEARPHHAGERG